MNNTTTARGLAILMTAIAEGKAVDAESSQQMARDSGRQKFNQAIPAGLPRGIRVAHKTGDITKVHNDAAIVYAKRLSCWWCWCAALPRKSGLRPDGLDCA